MSYESITSQGNMAFDAVRNDAYLSALTRVITPDSVVLDLGAGTGVLGLFAARLGAKRVYLVEPADIMPVTEAIVARNGLQDRVTCLHGRLEDVKVPEPVDVIISVMTGNFLLNEDLLPVLFAARDTLLKPGGHLIPDAAVMEAAPASAPSLYREFIDLWSRGPHGLDMTPGRQLAANTVYYVREHRADISYLAAPQPLLSMDFHTASYEALHARLSFEATVAGDCHGLAGWFRMRLGERWLSTSPTDPKLHWSPAFLPVDAPLSLVPAQQLDVAIDRLPKGDWSWRVRSGAVTRKHSTLLSAPLTTGVLDRASATRVPTRTADLEVTAYVLSSVDGSTTVSEIAARLTERFPDRFPSGAEALEFTQLALGRF
jgi:SAM-dependent methyltransferase